MYYIRNVLGNDKTNLNALNRNSGNTLLLYGRDMPQVIETINQYKSKFKHEPRGPLGKFELIPCCYRKY